MKSSNAAGGSTMAVAAALFLDAASEGVAKARVPQQQIRTAKLPVKARAVSGGTQKNLRNISVVNFIEFGGTTWAAWLTMSILANFARALILIFPYTSL